MKRHNITKRPPPERCGADSEKPGAIQRTDDGVKTAKAAARPPHSKKGGGPSPKKSGAGLEGRVDGLAVFRGERDFLVLLSEFFVHEGDGVVARRQAFDFELAVRTADRIEGVLTTLTNMRIHGCWLHFTGSKISSRAKVFSMGGAFAACDSFHPRLSFGVGCILCALRSPLTITISRPTMTPTTSRLSLQPLLSPA